MKTFLQNRYKELTGLDKTTIIYAASMAIAATLAISLVNKLDESSPEDSEDEETKED